MERNQILFFVKAAEYEHMTRAAEELNVSQPYLSNSISELESELGVKLFDRVGRGIKLNSYGEILYRYASQFISMHGDLLREIQEEKNYSRNQLTIATNATMYMPGLLTQIQRSLPETKIHLYTMPIKQISKQLAKGELDFAIVGPRAPEKFSSELLIADEGIIVHPRNHWLKDHNEIALKDLGDEVFISTRRGYAMADAVEGYFREHEIKMRNYIETADTNSALQFVKAGIGISMAAGSLIQSDPYFQENHVRISGLDVVGHTYLVWRKGQYLDRISKRFMEVTREYFSRLSEGNHK